MKKVAYYLFITYMSMQSLAADEWISIKDQPLPLTERVIFWDGFHKFPVVAIPEDYLFFYNYIEGLYIPITHWMKAPSAPQED